MDFTTDPYEQKLYSMFKSYEIDASGTLDEAALSELCRSLELRDEGRTVIQSLIKSDKTRVAFSAFKEALLNFLGLEMELINKDEKSIQIVAPNSPGREVSPKLIVGTKKYGRRSRPQSMSTDDSSPSDTDCETAKMYGSTGASATTQKVQRSSSQSEIQSNRRRRPTSGNKLKRCTSLPAQKNNQKLREQFTKQLHEYNREVQLTSSAESLDVPPQIESLPVLSILEMWESTNVPDPKTLLSNLGFEDGEVNVAQLTKVLEEEIRGLQGEALATLLKALLAIRSAEVNFIKKSFRQLSDQNRKLHADNKEVNKRAAMLAQEIDERHANLEDSTKTEIRMLEQRHAEIIRELTAQMANDRENWSTLNSRLESRLKSMEQEDNRLKAEIQTLQNENSALENEHISLQKQFTELLEKNIKLNKEIVNLEDKQRDEGDKTQNETDEVLELIEKITLLQTENGSLRDKNDELAAEVEELHNDLIRFKVAKEKSPLPYLTRNITNSEGSGTESLSDDPEHSSLGMKRRGDSPSKTRMSEESPRLGKFRRYCNNNEHEQSGDWIALNSELKTVVTSTTASSSGFCQDFPSISEAKDEEIRNLREEISKLEKKLSNLKSEKGDKNDLENFSKDEERQNYKERCLELENSLEQMRKAYEDCEDYWQAKLSDERQLFEKERVIYEEEQQESDKKFAELLDKVREYEEQFKKDERLSPIEEKYTLEQQYIELENEMQEIRQNSRKLLQEKCKEISELQELVTSLKLRLSENEIYNMQEIDKIESPASSPISYLWNQSTIHAPARDYQNPQWNIKQEQQRTPEIIVTDKQQENENTDPYVRPTSNNIVQSISPIQKPNLCKESETDSASNVEGSEKSFETRSLSSGTGVQRSHYGSGCVSPNEIKEDLKRLRYVELQLKEQIKDLAHKRDGLVMELQQLHEAKPVLEKAYARAAHPTLLQRVSQLEQKNRHLQNVLRQQQQYTESIMQQTWQQQRAEIAELRNRLETQGMIMTEQAQRLTNADILVKELYVENSHLTATIQRLEQQKSRANFMSQRQGISGIQGIP